MAQPPPRNPQRGVQRRPSEGELRYLLHARIVDRVADVLNGLVKWGALVLTIYFSYRTVDSLAGKLTFADIAVRFMTSMTVSKWAAYIFGTGGVLYGLKERQLRRRNIRRLAPTRIEYEKGIDPNRSSSGLTTAGTTSPEDV